MAVLAGCQAPLDTTAIAGAIRYPTQTTRRTLEDLAAHGVVKRAPQGQGKADLWRLSTWTEKKCIAARVTFPEVLEEEEE
jgi:DNA-binding IclR family transcriptional regulator